MTHCSIPLWKSICLTAAILCVAGCPAPECYGDLDCSADAFCGDENTCEPRPDDGLPASDAGVESDAGGATTDAGPLADAGATND